MTALFDDYGGARGPAYDEMFDADGLRPPYQRLRTSLHDLTAPELVGRVEALQANYLDQGVTFDIGGEERAFPLDILPRVIEMDTWSTIERGVQQRVRTLEAFLADVYDDGQVFTDGVIPRQVVNTSSHYHREAAGVRPPNGVRVHVSGIDLIRDDNGEFRVLEDNVRVPSGVSYVMTNRRAISAALPEPIAEHRIRPVAGYPQRLLAALRAAAPAGVPDPTVVVLTPGVYNGAYFEHALLARTMGVELVEGRDLECRRGRVMMRTTKGLEQVHVIYRRVDDEFLDPVHFRADSMLGCPGLIDAARAGNVTLANAVGNGVADDKLVYTYLPDLIRYYLNEEPVLKNVDTWRVGDAEAREEVLDRLDELVLKPVDGSGGKGIVIGPRATEAELDELRGKVLEDPRSWIAQPVVQLSTVPTFVDGKLGPRHVDLRPFAVNDGNRVWVLPGGLTRVALAEGELIVNSSRGGGSKDTWVLAGPGSTPPPRPASRRRRSPTTPQSVGPALSDALDSQPGAAATAAAGRFVMLSRIAESMFWIGRYVERAEDTARILDVQTQLILEESGVEAEDTCRTLLSIMGVEEMPEQADLTLVLRELAYDPSSPVSIASALGAARESARRARETLSVPMWEAINTTYRAIPSGHFGSLRPPSVFQWVRERAALINGTADATMTRDEGWHFLMLGRCIERADMTSRLVATASLAQGSGGAAPWTNTLRACGAYEAFLRTYKGLETERGAAEFLLLDRLFPRSVVFSLNRAELCVDNLEASGQRAGFQNEAQRLLGRTRAELEYRSLSDVMVDLPSEMERLQRTCALATEAITRRYFAGAEALTWQGILQ